MEAKEEIKKLSNNLGIIGVYDYEKHKEWEWKQKAKEYVKDDLALIDSLKEENDLIMKQIEDGKKFIEEEKKSLEEGQKSLEEDKKSFEEKSKAFDEHLASTAKKLLDNDFSIEEIMNITGLSKEKIESLKV